MNAPSFKNLLSLKSYKYYHPFLFALTQVLFLYAHNIEEVTLSSVFNCLFFTALGTIILWMIFLLFNNKAEKASLYLTSFILLFFTYGRMYKLVYQPAFSFWRYRIHTVYIVALIGSYLTIFFYKKSLKGICKILNFVSLVLILISIYNISFYFIKTYLTSNPKLNHNISTFTKDNKTFIEKKREIKFLPDIYYIILDAYAGDDVLGKLYNFKNDLTPFLKKKNFYIASSSRSNYHRTRFSVPSSLNFSYLDEALSHYNYKKLDPNTVKFLISQNRTMDFLKKYDYDFIAFQSDYSVTEVPDADEYFAIKGLGLKFDEFVNQLLDITPIPKILEKFQGTEYGFKKRRNRILYTFEKITTLGSRKKPFFVFAHVLAPHAPFVFGPNGEEIDHKGMSCGVQDADLWIGKYGTREEYEKKYVDQTSYINQHIKTLVEKIINHSGGKAIIIIQGDHGPGSRYFYDNPEKSCMWERMSILNAYYFPDQNYKFLYDSISPVNSFRVIFNTYFKTNFSILKDVSYNSIKKKQYDTLKLVGDFETNCE